MSGIVAGGGRRYRYVVSTEARAKAEEQTPTLPFDAGFLQKLDRRLTVWRVARRLDRGSRPSRHSLY